MVINLTVDILLAVRSERFEDIEFLRLSDSKTKLLPDNVQKKDGSKETNN